MAETSFVLPAPETVTMSGDAARRLVGCGSGDAALVYLYILSSGGMFNAEDAALKTGRTGNQIEAAMHVLSRLGLVNRPESSTGSVITDRPDELPQYTAEDVAKEAEGNPEFQNLVDEVKKSFGRLLSSDDLIKLYGIYNYLGLPVEVILQLVTYCREESARNGRAVTMRYVEKVAFSWEREGVFSLDTAESYIRRMEEKRNIYAGYAAAVQIRDRQFSATERKYVDAWAEMGFGPEAVAMAYDRTVMKLGKFVWQYADRIVRAWNEKNLHLPEEIETGDPWKVQPGQESPRPEQPVRDTATAEELERMRQALRQMKNGS